MPYKSRIIILHNIISPYKTLLFNEIHNIYSNVKVIYIAETEQRREWTISKADIAFPYEVMFSDPLDEICFWQLFKKTIEYLNLFKPEVLVIDGYIYASSWAGLLWAKLHNRKILLWSSSNAEDHERVWYKELPKKVFIKGCNAFNAYGTTSREYLVRLGAQEERIFLVGNNTCNDYYYHETTRWRNERDDVRRALGVSENNFLYIGRFSKEKNILTLLNAFKKLENKGSSEWGLVLLGSGPQQEEIEEYIACNKLRNVFLPGFKQKEEIPKYFAVSDLLVLPSTSEPWGLVVNEAMAAGLPVLVSRKCGCCPDLVKEGVTGFPFDPLDEQGLSCLMQRMVDGEVDLEQLGRNALAIIKDFTPAKAAEVVVNTVRMVSGEA